MSLISSSKGLVSRVYSLRSERQSIAKVQMEGNEQSTTQYDLDNITKCMQCYKSRPRGGVLTLESLRAGTVREWKYWAWSLEVRCQYHFLTWSAN